MKIKIVIALFAALFTFSCENKKQGKAFDIFNEGVRFSLDAADEGNKGNYEKASQLNRLAIGKFKETLKLDSNHEIAKSALAHSFYIAGEYSEAIKWFQLAMRTNEKDASCYRELGLCKINNGDYIAGKTDIDTAFLLDTSKEIRDITIQDIANIGKQAFEYGVGYIKQGEDKKGKDYQTAGVGILMLAYEYDSTQKNIALTISTLAERAGNNTIAKQYSILAAY